MSQTSQKTETAKLSLPDGRSVDLPVFVGSEHEPGVDVTELRSQSGYIALDPGLRNTGSCISAITYIDGEKGILRYRGVPIEQLAEHSTFVETAMLLIYGELPTQERLLRFRGLLTQHEMIHEGLRNHYDGFPANAPPMAILSAMINAVSCYHPDVLQMEDESTFESAAARLMSKVRTIAAASYKTSIGQPIIYPRPEYNYVRNFLHMMFSRPYKEYDAPAEVIRALQLFLILHADHEQNCSTSTVRMVASSRANLFASCAAGVCALWGWRHGGANTAVIQMLERIHNEKIPMPEFLDRVRKKQQKMMGFGHAVYKNYDPRAEILKAAAERVMNVLKISDPLLDIARQLEEVALRDSYFVERKLYPNVDFYSGIILRAIGLPVAMFPVMFAIGRMPGWIAHFREQHNDPDDRIFRPRQIYTGPAERPYVPIEQRA
ncbi:MAG: citrate synthase [Phycisphaeraceae bacterium]|nr:citrate synthase [Phycisphaeraceae bacterium]